jgi:hypothetical protein
LLTTLDVVTIEASKEEMIETPVCLAQGVDISAPLQVARDIEKQLVRQVQ